jgi:hypothetical protein
MLYNKSSAVLLVLLCSASVLAASNKDLERGDLKGAVKLVRTESEIYSGPAGNCSPDKRTIESVSKYNQDGNLTEFTDYNFNGTIHRRDVFGYNANGVRTSETSSDGSGFSFSKEAFDADHGGHPISESMYQENGSVDQTRSWQYDDTGQPIGTSTRNSKGDLIWSQTLDAAGKATEEDEYRDGTLISKRVNTYDSNGNRVESVHYKADGSLIDGPKDPARSEFSYDSKGQVVELIQYDSKRSLVWRLTYSYDKNGNIAEISSYSRGTVLVSHRTFEYEYDSAGNWTKQTISEDFSNTCSHPMQVFIRTITYY